MRPALSEAGGAPDNERLGLSMPSRILPLTERIERLLREADERSAVGDAREANELRERARKLHNETVSAELDRAGAGAVINLSDLIASAETLHVEAGGR